MNVTKISTVGSLVAMALVGQAVAGGVKVSNDEGQWAKLGGRIQLQYKLTDPDKGETTDELRFRRFRFYIEGSAVEDWYGKWQVEFGKGNVELKDAYFTYEGIEGMKLSFGNMNFPFSRELLTSSKKQELVERTFVGDHNYGTPDRQAGIHLAGKAMDGMLGWNVSGAMAGQDPDDKKLDFATTISLERGDDWSDGPMVGGRVEFAPMGTVKNSQGDLKNSDPKVAVAAAAFSWNNDDDNLDATRSKHDVDTVTGFEVSAAFRAMGLSVDAQYNLFNSELYDAMGEDGTMSKVSHGLYKNGQTDLTSYSVEGGYMVVPEKVELVAGYQSQDADGYATAWNRTSVGANYFVKGQNIKYQVTYEINAAKDGKDGNDVNELYVQAQYVF